MAKLQDKFFNRIIEGDLDLEASEIEAGASNGIKVFEDIKDKDGHERFIEGTIDIPEITGVTKTYGKWSLSGSHLLFVLALSVANTTALTSGLKVGVSKNLPSWLVDKIYPLFATNVVDFKSITFWGSGWSTQTAGFSLQKSSQGAVDLYCNANLTLNADRTCRISFDLLIDNE